jgi:hypothetical protein
MSGSFQGGRLFETQWIVAMDRSRASTSPRLLHYVCQRCSCVPSIVQQLAIGTVLAELAERAVLVREHHVRLRRAA